MIVFLSWLLLPTPDINKITDIWLIFIFCKQLFGEHKLSEEIFLNEVSLGESTKIKFILVLASVLYFGTRGERIIEHSNNLNNTRSHAALQAADLDWNVGPGYSSGGYILDKNHEKPALNHEKPTWNHGNP